ncbi:hypothetical protein [Streptomyces sp. NPDC048845]|uniref:hypothetical protein n=1 Tax=Streptomyces sp. NPDC048845 TaxID=3155390 RepID=UPI00343EE99C
MTTPPATTSFPPAPADTSQPPPIWFVAPDGFYALPLAGTAEERAERSREFVRGLYSRGDESLWEPAAPYYAGLAELMAGQGVSYAAMGLYSTADEESAPDAGVAQCAFTLAAVPTGQETTAPDIAAQGILAVLSADPHNDARWLDLPCGPAVSSVTLTKYEIDPDITATGDPKSLLTGQIQVHIPFPTGPYTAVFTLHTASTDYWAEFCDLIMTVLRTVSFEEPEIGIVRAGSAEDGPGSGPAHES